MKLISKCRICLEQGIFECSIIWLQEQGTEAAARVWRFLS